LRVINGQRTARMRVTSMESRQVHSEAAEANCIQA
jgi:hypothetical protein